MFGRTSCAAHRSHGNVLACVVYFDWSCDLDVSGAQQSSWSFSAETTTGAQKLPIQSNALIFIIRQTTAIAILNIYVIFLLLVFDCLLNVEFCFWTLSWNPPWNYLQIRLLVFKFESHNSSARIPWFGLDAKIIVYYLITELLYLRSAWPCQSRHIYLNVGVGLRRIHLMDYVLIGILTQRRQTYNRWLNLWLVLNHAYAFMSIFEKAVWVIHVGRNYLLRCLFAQNVAGDAWLSRV